MENNSLSASKEFWTLLDRVYFAPVNLIDVEELTSSLLPIEDDKSTKISASNETISNNDQPLIEDELNRLKLKLKNKEDSIRSITSKIMKAVSKEIRSNEEEMDQLGASKDEIMAAWNLRSKELFRKHTQVEKLAEEDRNTLCSICKDGYAAHNDVIVFCDRCDVGVHRSCYHIKGDLPKDEWYCRPCAEHISLGGSPEKVDRKGECRGLHDVVCPLCNLSGGSFVPCDMKRESKDFSRKGSTILKKNRYVHAACAQWLATQKKHISQNDDGFVTCAKYMERVEYKDPSLKTRRCIHCKSKEGAMLRCLGGKCRERFHVPCAFADDKIFMDTSFISKEDSEWGVYCPLHSKHHFEFSSESNTLPTESSKRKRNV